MGVRNLRAICPNCGAKIHTQPKGLGHITWMNSWMLVQTGTECPNCSVALSGKVGPDNHATLASDHTDEATELPPPTVETMPQPDAPSGGAKNTKAAWIGVAVVLVLVGVIVAASSGADDDSASAEPASERIDLDDDSDEAGASGLDDAEIDRIALDLTWSRQSDTVCRHVRTLRARGMDEIEIRAIAVSSFREGAGGSVNRPQERYLWSLIERDC